MPPWLGQFWLIWPWPLNKSVTNLNTVQRSDSAQRSDCSTPSLCRWQTSLTFSHLALICLLHLLNRGSWMWILTVALGVFFPQPLTFSDVLFTQPRWPFLTFALGYAPDLDLVNLPLTLNWVALVHFRIGPSSLCDYNFMFCASPAQEFLCSAKCQPPSLHVCTCTVFRLVNYCSFDLFSQWWQSARRKICDLEEEKWGAGFSLWGISLSAVWDAVLRFKL